VKRLDHYWYSKNPVAFLLLPFAALFAALAALRRAAYRVGLLRQERLAVPVVVVGNITVGGSGKTPLVIWLVECLRAAGFNPGVVSRGYGGDAARWPQWVTPDSDPRAVGDEPVLIARRTGCPVAVAPSRVEAAKFLLQRAVCDVVICDDGLQHYALARDIEIAVVDGARRFGNGWLLPAGPLREAPARLRTVDFIVANGGSYQGAFDMALRVSAVRRIADPDVRRELDDFRGQPVHAVAGIGNPGRFFAQLRAAGVRTVEHPFPDHHVFRADDLEFGDAYPVLMTEKDAVKCRTLTGGEFWYVTVDAHVDARLGESLALRLGLLRQELGHG
jgi:tetraacyldisaccharide 4'-kinase